MKKFAMLCAGLALIGCAGLARADDMTGAINQAISQKFGGDVQARGATPGQTIVWDGKKWAPGDTSGFTGGSIANPLLLPNGSVGTPALEFVNDTATGFYSSGSHSGGIAFSSSGTKVFEIGPTGITTGTWLGTGIGAMKGGTGQTSWTAGDMLYASASNTLAKRAAGTNGQVWTMVSGLPAWANGSASSLAATLAVGSTTSGHDIIVSSGDRIFGVNNGSLFQMQMGNNQGFAVYGGGGNSAVILENQVSSGWVALDTLGTPNDPQMALTPIGLYLGNGQAHTAPVDFSFHGTRSTTNGTPGSTIRMGGGLASQDSDGGGSFIIEVAVVGSGTAESIAAVWSNTLETRLGGTIAQPTQVSQAATKTLDSTAAYWNGNSATAQTFTLPDATACAGRVYNVKRVGAGTLTIATTSSQKIDGGTSLTVSTQYQSYTLVSDGVQWWIY